MWNEIAKYDVVTLHISVNDQEESIQGEITFIDEHYLLISDCAGVVHTVVRDDLVDMDHITRAHRDEDDDMYDGSPNGYYLYR